MKTLVVYNDRGNVIFTLNDVKGDYGLLIQDIALGNEAVAVDIENNKAVTIESNANEEKKSTLIEETVEKNKNYNNAVELAKTTKAYEELTSEVKTDIERLKSANIEIIDYVNVVTEMSEEE